MPALARLSRRQLWANPNPTSYIPKECRPVRLRSGGLLNIGNDTIVTLARDAVFQPECSDYPDYNANASGFNISAVADREPFYASTSPQIYAIAAATVVSYMLLIILFITPRTFFVGGAGGGSGFLGRRGMISGAAGSTSVIGVGSRPWLQKVAALTVAVSLTIASVDTFRIAEIQYKSGYQDATALTDAVAHGLEIRIVRIISETCLWLAQAQTLIRLFPRHKEKVLIKWTAFALILLDVIFSILNGFVYGNPKTRPRTFVDTVPALNYLFTIALSILYMAWVLYYSISKRRFAFYHPKMRNIGLMAVLSLTAILIPVLFFILDIAKPNVSGWGNYVRWVGAAAASVVVWEWVERIEALERDENKDGILGREIFDGDEMLEDLRSGALPRGLDRNNGGGGGAWKGPGRRHGSGRGMASGWSGATTFAHQLGRVRFRRPGDRKSGHRDRRKPTSGDTERNVNAASMSTEQPTQIMTPPPTTVSPVSRTDTTSAASTVYRIHYHRASVAATPIQEANEPTGPNTNNISQPEAEPWQENLPADLAADKDDNPNPQKSFHPWQRIPNPFKRQRSSPPVEISQALSQREQMSPSTHNHTIPQANTRHSGIFRNLRNRDRRKAEETPLPLTVIPWQPRGTRYLESLENRTDPPETTLERPIPSRQDAIYQSPDAVAIAVENTRRSAPRDVPLTPAVPYLPDAVLPRDVGPQDHQQSLSSRGPTSDLGPLAEVAENSRFIPPLEADLQEGILAPTQAVDSQLRSEHPLPPSDDTSGVGEGSSKQSI